MVPQGFKQDLSSSKTSKCEISVIRIPKHSKRHSCRRSNIDFEGRKLPEALQNIPKSIPEELFSAASGSSPPPCELLVSTLVMFVLQETLNN